MIGISAVGGYVPRYRLSGKLLASVWGGGGGGGERAVANYDEDSLTMACEAALNALHGHDPSRIGACLLASHHAAVPGKNRARPFSPRWPTWATRSSPPISAARSAAARPRSGWRWIRSRPAPRRRPWSRPPT